MGAEFIHGESSVLLNRLKAAKDVAIDVSRVRWVVQADKLRRAGQQMGELKRIFSRLPVPVRDTSFAEFLKRHRRSVPPAVRQLACMIVQGFDAADPSRISAREVLDEWNGPAAADAPTFRPARGYDSLIQAMSSALPGDGATLNLGTVVRAVTWRRGHVTIEAERHGESIRVQAERAIVTLPLGVLQLPAASPNAIRFTPELRSKRTALSHLASGPVIKVAMHFAWPFWAELHGSRYRGAAFFFAPKTAFPIFWTSLPLRSSLLVAWCGGPNADRLPARARRSHRQSHGQSRAIFGRRNYRSLLEHVWWHDWQRDPFSCGAYSYVTAQGGRARSALARPVDDTCSSPARRATRKERRRPSAARWRAEFAPHSRS